MSDVPHVGTPQLPAGGRLDSTEQRLATLEAQAGIEPSAAPPAAAGGSGAMSADVAAIKKQAAGQGWAGLSAGGSLRR